MFTLLITEGNPSNTFTDFNPACVAEAKVSWRFVSLTVLRLK